MADELSERALLCLMGARPGPRRIASPGPDIPVEGSRAVERWLALHDRAVALQQAWLSGQCQLPRVVWGAIHSLFLYEHQLSPEARRRVRMALWLRDREDLLPGLVTLHRCAACRCPHCQPQRFQSPAGQPSLLLRAA